MQVDWLSGLPDGFNTKPRLVRAHKAHAAYDSDVKDENENAIRTQFPKYFLFKVSLHSDAQTSLATSSHAWIQGGVGAYSRSDSIDDLEALDPDLVIGEGLVFVLPSRCLYCFRGIPMFDMESCRPGTLRHVPAPRSTLHDPWIDLRSAVVRRPHRGRGSH